LFAAQARRLGRRAGEGGVGEAVIGMKDGGRMTKDGERKKRRKTEDGGRRIKSPASVIRPPSSVVFGLELTSDFLSASRREWLVTNGLGGWASGTVSGANTRRYHGLFVPALQPPLGRAVLVSKLNDWATLEGQVFPLSSNEYGDGAINPHGYRHIETFRLDGLIPTWTFSLAEALLEKRVWMPHGQNTVFITYTLRRAQRPLSLEIWPMVTRRDVHAETHGAGWQPEVASVEGGAVVKIGDLEFRLLANRGAFTPAHEWHWNIKHRLETERGLPDREDQFAAGKFTADLAPGETFAFVASSEHPERTLSEASAKSKWQSKGPASLDWETSLTAERDRAQALIAQAETESEPEWIQQLVLAADQFIVQRGEGQTVIAGYHWFGDWGRDTMIALPGLTLATKRFDVAANLLRTFARYVSDGLLPNRFPDVGETPEYNTVDATLWYFHAIDQYLEASADRALVRELFPVLEEIVDWHLRGTRYHIHVDSKDGLLYAGEPGVQLTWMDAKVGDWVITPRIGKPVEINALWINALRVMDKLRRKLRRQAKQPYAELAAQAQKSFEKFWYAEGGYLYDVIEGSEGNDTSLRPNQLFAISLPYGPLAGKESQTRVYSIVDVCAEQLLTSYGLRSLSPRHPAYVGNYGGDQRQRDVAYHQGTVWAWLIGAFVEAHWRVYQDAEAARSFLTPFEHHLSDFGLGSIAEIFDGDAPFTPRGCIAQAWSVAEVLRIALELTTKTRSHEGH
jgi:predicted glycogen debranching enzyme